MNCHCLPCKRWIYAPLLHFRPTVLAKVSLNIQEAESHVPYWSYQRHQKPPPAWSQGVYRHMTTEEAQSDGNSCVGACGLRGSFQPFAPLSFLSIANPTKGYKWFSMCWCLVSPLELQCQFCPQKQSGLSADICWNTWVLNMECVSSLVVPIVISSLLGRRLVSVVSIYSWTGGKPECQTSQIFQSHSKDGVLCKAMKNKDAT